MPKAAIGAEENRPASTAIAVTPAREIATVASSLEENSFEKNVEASPTKIPAAAPCETAIITVPSLTKSKCTGVLNSLLYISAMLARNMKTSAQNATLAAKNMTTMNAAIAAIAFCPAVRLLKKFFTDKTAIQAGGHAAFKKFMKRFITCLASILFLIFMAKKEFETVVISLGGSVMAPSQIDADFLKGFKQLIGKFMGDGCRFAIICGGGKTAREYQNAARSVVQAVPEDLDWLGIHATRLNAHLLRTIFRETAYPRVVKNPNERITLKESERIVVAAGWKPGRSTDYIAVLLAKNLGARTVINITNTDFVYDKDPTKFHDAKPVQKISWKDFRKLIGVSKWSPGLNTPFDPVAAKTAEKMELKVAVIGKDIVNLENFLAGKQFRGTVIS